MLELWQKDQVIDHETSMNTLGGHSRKVHIPNINLTKDTSNGDEIIIVLSDSIKM